MGVARTDKPQIDHQTQQFPSALRSHFYLFSSLFWFYSPQTAQSSTVGLMKEQTACFSLMHAVCS